MKNTRLDELQAGIKITRRNINNFRYVDDATVMAESEEELKNLLLKVKEESEKASLNLNIKRKGKRLRHPAPLMANRRGKTGSSDRFLLLGLLKSPKMVTAAMKLEDDCFLARKLSQT